jgi:hypothetical protein
MAMTSAKILLGTKKRRVAPGRGFKVKVDDKWSDYASEYNEVLSQGYTAGCPSMRLLVKGCLWEFDFEKMKQTNLITLNTHPIRAPHDAQRPERHPLCRIENLRHPSSEGSQALKEAVSPPRPVYVVCVPSRRSGNWVGDTLVVPHPKKLGQTMSVTVPSDAKAGRPLFITMPRTSIKKKIEYGSCGMVTGGSAVGVGIAVSEAAGGMAAGGAAAVGCIAATGVGLAVVGGVVAAGAAARYAMRNPGKAVAIGALTVGGLACASHVAEVGLVEAVGDVADGIGDAVEGVSEVAEATIDATEYVADAAMDAGEWVTGGGDDIEAAVDFTVDFAEDLVMDLW